MKSKNELIVKIGLFKGNVWLSLMYWSETWMCNKRMMMGTVK